MDDLRSWKTCSNMKTLLRNVWLDHSTSHRQYHFLYMSWPQFPFEVTLWAKKPNDASPGIYWNGTMQASLLAWFDLVLLNFSKILTVINFINPDINGRAPNYGRWPVYNQFPTLLSISFARTFNPADYAEPAQTEENYGGGSTWNNTGSVDLEEGASKLI